MLTSHLAQAYVAWLGLLAGEIVFKIRTERVFLRAASSVSGLGLAEYHGRMSLVLLPNRLTLPFFLSNVLILSVLHDKNYTQLEQY